MSIELISPKVALITGRVSRYAPVSVKIGLVAPGEADVGLTVTVVAVPTSVANVAYTSEAAYVMNSDKVRVLSSMVAEYTLAVFPKTVVSCAVLVRSSVAAVQKPVSATEFTVTTGLER
jgi:hypothetical protein